VVAVDADGGRVYYQDVERSRVEGEECREELGYKPVRYAWHEPPPVELRDVEDAIAPLRRALNEEEAERYRAAGADAAEAMISALEQLTPELMELEAAAILAGEAWRRGLVVAVNLAAGEERQPVHRHPLPTRRRRGSMSFYSPVPRSTLRCSLRRRPAFRAVRGGLESLDHSRREVGGHRARRE